MNTVKMLTALSQETRYQIAMCIANANGEYPCTQLQTALNLSKSTISHHVQKLREAGLIHVRRDGKYFYYTANMETLVRLLSEMEKDLAISDPSGVGRNAKPLVL